MEVEEHLQKSGTDIVVLTNMDVSFQLLNILLTILTLLDGD